MNPLGLSASVCGSTIRYTRVTVWSSVLTKRSGPALTYPSSRSYSLTRRVPVEIKSGLAFSLSKWSPSRLSKNWVANLRWSISNRPSEVAPSKIS